MDAAMARNKRTVHEHEMITYELSKQLRERGIHSLSISQRMDIAHYCFYRGAYDINETCSLPTLCQRLHFISAFNYQSVVYRHKMTPRQGVNFLTPHIHQEKMAGIKTNIENAPHGIATTFDQLDISDNGSELASELEDEAGLIKFFTALNSTIELEDEPLHLLNIGHDCLSLIGEMVVENNKKRWLKWSYKYYGRVKKKCGFVTDWSLFDVMDFTQMQEEHDYNIPMTIRNYCTAWGYRTDVVVVGRRWLDIWQACDALIRNTKDKDGDLDHHRFIERLVRPGHESFDQYAVREFLEEDDSDYNGSDGEYDENTWYLINGS
jgi:hypothetical protein